MEGTTELRKLPPGAVFGLVRILEGGEAWKQLIAIIPKSDSESSDDFIPKYRGEHVKLIEQAGDKQRRSCAEIFLEEWSTSGRKRPNLTLLVQLLGKANLYRAADYVTELLKVPPLERPTTGPAALVDVSKEALEKLVARLPPEVPKNLNNGIDYNTDEINRAFDEMTMPDSNLPSLNELHGPADVNRNMRTADEVVHNSFLDSLLEESFSGGRSSESERLAQQETMPVDQLERNASLHLNTLLPHIKYTELDLCTDHFNELPLFPDRGRKLGTGAFGSVYLGILQSEKCVAVKKLNKDAINVELQFRNEVEALSKFRHTNLLSLVGYSCDGPTYCLVYEYMSNGSLQDRLACKQQQMETLQWHTRLNIALGTAQGILYLHTAFNKPLIHRDIKSANILLDEQLVPKLGDFGLVRLGQQHGNTVTMSMTTTVLGTSAYMAPEAFRGDVSIKLDTFSFGVVLLEILTGLPPYDEDREGCDLVTHVEAMCEESGKIDVLLDMKAGDWGKTHVGNIAEVSSVADGLYSVALSCIEDNRQKRPNMIKVVQMLEEIIQKVT